MSIIDKVKKFGKEAVRTGAVGINKGGPVNAGKIIKKGAKWMGGQIQKEMEMDEEKDKEDRENAPVGAYGGTNKGEYKPAINPSINTKSKKNSSGEIINPTEEDVKEYNRKYETVKKGRATSNGYMRR